MERMNRREIDVAATRHLQPGTFTADHVPDDAAKQLAGLVAVLDLQETYAPILRLREWAAEQLALTDGSVVLDVGSGTGTEAIRLAELVGPSGRSVGVEPHAGLRGVARGRAEEEGSPAEFVDGLAGDLPFPDGTADGVRCERVLQHLPDPQGAVDEMARVLRPGGRVVLVDSDWGTSTMSHGDPDVVRRYAEMTRRIQPNPFAGRHLREYVLDAGLELLPDVGTAVLILPPPGVRTLGMLETGLRTAVDEGALTQEEADGFRADVLAAMDRGSWHSSVTMFAVVGRKPSP